MPEILQIQDCSDFFRQESLVLMGLVDIDMLRSGPVLKEKDTGDVSKFLNRILGLTVEKQNMVGKALYS